jgi:replicative DNA helicase
MRGVRTGFKDLDNMLAGLQKSDLIILAARPSWVKPRSRSTSRAKPQSTTARWSASSLSKCPRSSYRPHGRRRGKVNSWNLRTGHINDQDDFTRIREAYDRLGQAPIYIDDQPGNNILQDARGCSPPQKRNGLGLIVVDYLQLMVPTGARASDNDGAASDRNLSLA